MKKICLFASKKYSFANVQKMQYPHFSERCIDPILGVQNLQHFTPTKSILSEKRVRVKMRMEGGRRTGLFLCTNNLQIQNLKKLEKKIRKVICKVRNNDPVSVFGLSVSLLSLL